jgi:hypothetical protein
MFHFWLNDNSILCHGHENYKDERISKGHEQTMTKTSLILNQRMEHKNQKNLTKFARHQFKQNFIMNTWKNIRRI